MDKSVRSTSLEQFRIKSLYVIFPPHWEWGSYWIGDFGPFFVLIEDDDDSSRRRDVLSFNRRYYLGSFMKG